MAQPPAYNRTKDFGADYPDQTDNQAINTELDAVASSINGIRANLAEIQRDDGGLRDGIVTKDSLATSLKDELYDEFSGNINDSVLEAQQAAADATNAAAAASNDASLAVAARNDAVAASTASQASAAAASASQSAAFGSASSAAASASSASGSASTAGTAATTATDAATAAVQARDEAVPAAATATTKAAEALASATAAAADANAAQQWATKTDGPVVGSEFSAKHYAELAAQGMGLPIFPPNAIPTTNVGPIFVSGQGPMEWNGSRYVVLWGDHGQCRFVYVSTNECRLMPHNGNGLIINGRQCRIDPAGAAITTAATSANGRYWVLAFDDGSGGVSLELAATAGASYSINNDGVMVKTGDPTRTLVGWLGTTGGNQFQDSGSGNRFVASWFNRRRRSVSEQISGAFSATSMTGLGGGRSLFNWAGEEVEAHISGYGVLSTSNFYTVEMRRDGVVYVPAVAAGRNGGGPGSASNISASEPTEGSFTYQLFGSVNTGSVTLASRLTCTTNI